MLRGVLQRDMSRVPVRQLSATDHRGEGERRSRGRRERSQPAHRKRRPQVQERQKEIRRRQQRRQEVQREIGCGKSLGFHELKTIS